MGRTSSSRWSSISNIGDKGEKRALQGKASHGSRDRKEAVRRKQIRGREVGGLPGRAPQLQDDRDSQSGENKKRVLAGGGSP